MTDYLALGQGDDTIKGMIAPQNAAQRLYLPWLGALLANQHRIARHRPQGTPPRLHDNVWTVLVGEDNLRLSRGERLRLRRTEFNAKVSEKVEAKFLPRHGR